ncbi:MAG: flavin reductase family protein [Dehalococcoidia bacterium]|jgi:flavin reductase (DIM6/NTAB) family NADH-FMN oxidoreductase RutF
MDAKALYLISYGMYIICSKKGDKINGQTANSVIQVASEPPIISVCINKQNFTHEFIKESKVFTVSILAQTAPLKLIGGFGFKSGRDVNKFEGVKYKLGQSGAPVILDSTLGYLEAKVIDSVDAKTHTIFVGELIDAEVLGEGEPMTYAYYHMVKRGTTPKSAPSFNKA